MCCKYTNSCYDYLLQYKDFVFAYFIKKKAIKMKFMCSKYQTVETVLRFVCKSVCRYLIKADNNRSYL